MSGPKVRGNFRPVGGDWNTIRADGVSILDVRSTSETQDGALIYMAYTGVADLGEDAYQKFLQGELPSTAQVRIVPRFQTAHPDYKWLNRLQCLGIGQLDVGRFEVRVDVYAVH